MTKRLVRLSGLLRLPSEKTGGIVDDDGGDVPELSEGWWEH